MNTYGDNTCKFFSKMGACRNGEGCKHIHHRPANSPTVLFPMMYPNPLAMENLPEAGSRYNFQYDKKYIKKHFEHFYKNVWRTFMELGRIAELRVVSNLGEHLLGNVYIKFENPNDAANAAQSLKGKAFEGILLLPEMSPVVDFANGCCKEDVDNACSRGNACNYLHIMKISKSVMEKLEKEQTKFYKKKERDQDGGKRKRSRSRSPKERHQPVSANDICHICGKTGHISRDCPLKP